MASTEEIITSAANPIVKRLRQLADRKYRAREGAAVVSGLQPVWQAVEAGIEVDTFIVAPGLLRHEGALEMVASHERRGTRVVRVSTDLFARLSDRDGPAGLAAIVRQRWTSLDAVAVPTVATFVALDRISNPGNLGTILRTADATGCSGVFLIGPSADPYDPGAIKASMGAVFSVPLIRAPVETFFGWAKRSGVAVVTTSSKADTPLWQARFPGRMALLMGQEGPGLDDRVLAQGALRVGIPMTGTAESLNLAVATGVLLYEIWRQRAS